MTCEELLKDKFLRLALVWVGGKVAASRVSRTSVDKQQYPFQMRLARDGDAAIGRPRFVFRPGMMLRARRQRAASSGQTCDVRIRLQTR